MASLGEPVLNFEDWLELLEGQRQQLLELAEVEHGRWRASLDGVFARLSLRHLQPLQPLMLEGAFQPGPKQPLLISETADPWPEMDWNEEYLATPSASPQSRCHTPRDQQSMDVMPDARKEAPLANVLRPESERANHSPATKFKSASKNIISTRENFTRGFNKAAACMDYLAGFLVLLNSAVMMLELEMLGRAIGRELGNEGGPAMQDIQGTFAAVHHTFVFVFLAELFLRIALGKLDFFKDMLNWLDIILVLAGLSEILFMEGNPRNILLIRLMRSLKALRAIRMVRTFRIFRGLQLLVQACTCFLPSLGWSMALLTVFMSIATLVLGNLLQDFMLDTAAVYEDRVWIWEHYGTAYRAMYTLFEITFAGNWPTNARPVLEKAGHSFVIFFVVYITIIVFAVTKVIGAIFLKDTLDAAQADAEHLVVDRLRKKAEYVQKLEGVFMAIDEAGDGMISEEKLTTILTNPKVEAYFHTLDVDVTEGAALFKMLDNGDGQLSLDEFIDGILRCRGPARALDQVAMRADLKQLDAKMTTLLVATGHPPRRSSFQKI